MRRRYFTFQGSTMIDEAAFHEELERRYEARKAAEAPKRPADVRYRGGVAPEERESTEAIRKPQTD